MPQVSDASILHIWQMYAVSALTSIPYACDQFHCDPGILCLTGLKVHTCIRMYGTYCTVLSSYADIFRDALLRHRQCSRRRQTEAKEDVIYLLSGRRA